MIAGVFLAAGSGSRFGGDKLLREVAGMPLYWLGLSQALASRLDEVVAVVGPLSGELERDIERRTAGSRSPLIVCNRGAAGGMMSSLKEGLRALPGGCDGAMVLLADMPLVTAIMIDELIAAFERRPAIVVPECGGEIRHPRLIPARLFPEFLELADGDKGTKVLEKHHEEIVRVTVGSELNFIDVDTPADLDALGKL